MVIMIPEKKPKKTEKKVTGAKASAKTGVKEAFDKGIIKNPETEKNWSKDVKESKNISSGFVKGGE